MNVEIRVERTIDRESIRHVNQRAFGGDDEANLVDSLRDRGFVEVSLVAETDGQVIGHILFSKVKINTKVGTVDALSLAPMAVARASTSGIGTAQFSKSSSLSLRKMQRNFFAFF
jgi:putative acetyltransferase